MARFKIIIGDKNYSSWSLRGWIALSHCTVDFDEFPIQLRKPTTSARAARAHARAARAEPDQLVEMEI